MFSTPETSVHVLDKNRKNTATYTAYRTRGKLLRTLLPVLNSSRRRWLSTVTVRNGILPVEATEDKISRVDPVPRGSSAQNLITSSASRVRRPVIEFRSQLSLSELSVYTHKHRGVTHRQ